ncbi:hypothetical protein F383_22161 [Gossypium arboreum]|uniref:Uncharacterized protein n=1 Tax=Gossypium arboreum TaxID=29729 RepID=A0A0B0MQT4_GOSAR|nr:hypothetical protein F383_22161 [Gossypium arboreum]
MDLPRALLGTFLFQFLFRIIINFWAPKKSTKKRKLGHSISHRGQRIGFKEEQSFS